MDGPGYNMDKKADRYNFSSLVPQNDQIDVAGVVPLQDHTNTTAVSNYTTSNYTTACSNDYCVSDEDYVDMIMSYIKPDIFEWILIIVYIIVFLVGIVGNFLVCFVVWKNKSMQTVTNYFIVNLSVADFFVILICLPPTVLEDVTETWYMEYIMCKIVKYFQGVSVSVSILTLTVISIERYYAICHPLAFRNTTKRVRILILIIWITALSIYAPELYTLGLQRRIKSDITVLLTSCKPVGWEYNVQAGYTLCLIVALYVLPFCIMGFAYAHIAMCLWSQAIPSESNTQLNSNNRHLNHVDNQNNFHQQLLARRKVAKMLIAVVIMFGICYLPVHMLNILRYAQVKINDTVAIYFALIAHWLCYFNSAVNPVIYNFMSAKFQKEFAHTCSCCSFILRPTRHHRRPTAYHGDSTYSYRYANTLTETEHVTLKTLGPHNQYD